MRKIVSKDSCVIIWNFGNKLDKEVSSLKMASILNGVGIVPLTPQWVVIWFCFQELWNEKKAEFGLWKKDWTHKEILLTEAKIFSVLDTKWKAIHF